ncbi:MAG: archease [Candidatus Thermoplasmatota archaeon]|nr:archease [Candidatus Thermoplasmatota archaeon]
MIPFELIDHTADVGIKATGEDLEETFQEAARGMFSIISDLSKVERKNEYKFEIEEDNLENLLVSYLSELIYLHEVKNALFSDFEVDIKSKNEGKTIKAKAVGEEIDLDKHDMDTAVKAVSYHELSIDPEGEIKIILDI